MLGSNVHYSSSTGVVEALQLLRGLIGIKISSIVHCMLLGFWFAVLLGLLCSFVFCCVCYSSRAASLKKKDARGRLVLMMLMMLLLLSIVGLNWVKLSLLVIQENVSIQERSISGAKHPTKIALSKTVTFVKDNFQTACD